jgi:hypothetical protein
VPRIHPVERKQHSRLCETTGGIPAKSADVALERKLMVGSPFSGVLQPERPDDATASVLIRIDHSLAPRAIIGGCGRDPAASPWRRLQPTWTTQENVDGSPRDEPGRDAPRRGSNARKSGATRNRRSPSPPWRAARRQPAGSFDATWDILDGRPAPSATTGVFSRFSSVGHPVRIVGTILHEINAIQPLSGTSRLIVDVTLEKSL